jgi:phage baseplate assembly protein gpV
MPNYIRRPLATSLDKNQRGAAAQAVSRQTRSWPCSVVSIQGSIVTVKFEVQSQWTIQQMTIPLFGPEYVRYPIQQGCKGYVMAADTTLSNMSGLGPLTPPDVSQPPNLSGLVFMPIANSAWTAPIDPNKIELYGPAGFVIHDTASNSTITGTTSEITIVRGATTITMDGTNITFTGPNFIVDCPTITLNGQMTQGTGSTSYAATLQGPLTVVNDVTAEGTSLHTHKHSGVTTGSGDTGAPV